MPEIHKKNQLDLLPFDPERHTIPGGILSSIKPVIFSGRPEHKEDYKDIWVVKTGKGHYAYYSAGRSDCEDWRMEYAQLNGDFSLLTPFPLEVKRGSQNCAPGVRLARSQRLRGELFAQQTCFDADGAILHAEGDLSAFGEFRTIITAREAGLDFLYDPKPVNEAVDRGYQKSFGVSVEDYLIATGGVHHPAAGYWIDRHGNKKPRVMGTLQLLKREGGKWTRIRELVNPKSVRYHNQLMDSAQPVEWGIEAGSALFIDGVTLIYAVCFLPEGNAGMRQRGHLMAVAGGNLETGTAVPLGIVYNPKKGEFGAGCMVAENDSIHILAQIREGNDSFWRFHDISLDRGKLVEYAKIITASYGTPTKRAYSQCGPFTTGTPSDNIPSFTKS